MRNDKKMKQSTTMEINKYGLLFFSFCFMLSIISYFLTGFCLSALYLYNPTYSKQQLHPLVLIPLMVRRRPLPLRRPIRPRPPTTGLATLPLFPLGRLTLHQILG